MKLNCDMGESFGSWTKGMDADVMPFIDMANIACGFHASDPLTMDQTVRMAIAENVTIGAHPGYPDLLGFGRRDIDLRPELCQPDRRLRPVSNPNARLAVTGSGRSGCAFTARGGPRALGMTLATPLRGVRVASWHRGSLGS